MQWLRDAALAAGDGVNAGLSLRGKRTPSRHTRQPPDDQDLLTGLARDKPYARDLGRRAETLWRTPVSGPAARIDPEPAELCEAGRERLLEPDEEIPRQELAAVRMTGQPARCAAAAERG